MEEARLPLLEEIKILKDKYLRSMAENENLRNRTRVEVASAREFGIQKFAKDLMPVADIMVVILVFLEIVYKIMINNLHLHEHNITQPPAQPDIMEVVVVFLEILYKRMIINIHVYEHNITQPHVLRWR